MSTSGLLATPPLLTDGVPLGLSNFPGYRFYVQAAIASPSNVLPFVLPGVLGGPSWVDLTKDMAGINWERGGEAGQRPTAGQVSIRLNNLDCMWCAWQNSYYGPGTLLRVLIYDGTTMKYQFVGIVQAWEEAGQGLLAYEWVDITAWDPQFLWNDVNENALLSGVGAGENLAARVARLCTKVDWQFGQNAVTATGATFQATDLAQDMATELYLTVDSIDAVAWINKTGDLMVRDRSVGNGVAWTIQQVDVNPDELKTANNDDRILAQVALARVGGSEVVYVNTGVAARYYRRSTKRDGLITVAEAADADLARVSTGILGRSNQTYRPVSLALESGQGIAAQNIMVNGEITDRVTVRCLAGDGSRLVFFSYALCKMSINVMVKDGGTYWSGILALDIEVDSHWSHFLPIWTWGVSVWGSTTEGWGP